MYKRIVVPVDLTREFDNVLDVAATLARRMAAAVRLVTVASPNLDHDVDERDLAALARRVLAPQVETAMIESNDVAGALLDAVADDELLCIETRAHGPFASFVLGSVANDVLFRATLPLLLVGPAVKPAPLDGVLQVCIDGPDAAAALVPVAGAWGRDLDLHVRVVNVWAPHDGDVHTADQLVADAVRRLHEQFDLDADGEVLHSPVPALAIVDDERGHDAAVVCVAVRPRSSFHRRVLGSVADGVAHAATA